MCAELLVKWGGHKAAAGLTIAADRIGEFARRFEEIAQQYESEIFIPHGKVDMELPMVLAGPKLVRALEELEPHGMGNPAPLFALRGVRFNLARVFGKEQNHLKLEFENGLEGIWWRGAQHFARNLWRYEKLHEVRGRTLDMVFQLGWNSFHRKMMLEIRDIGRLF